MRGLLKPHFVFSTLLLWLSLSLAGCAVTGISQNSASANLSTPDLQEQVCADWLKGNGLKQLQTGQTSEFYAVSNTLACYDGEIDKVGAENMIQWAAQIPENSPSRLVIRSQGGNVTHGLNIGEALQKNNTAVSVVDMCSSSCVNYVFLAAADRSLIGEVILDFHGGLDDYGLEKSRKDFMDDVPNLPEWVRKDPEKAFSQIENQHKRERAIQIKLMHNVGLNENIITDISVIGRKKIPLKECGSLFERDDTTYHMTYSPEQFEKRGVKLARGAFVTSPQRIQELQEKLGYHNQTSCFMPY